MSNITRTVFCRFEFEGFHQWPNAPESVAFLRDRHRHIFHVEARKPVSHNDRDTEFILMKWAMEHEAKLIRLSPEVASWSCEQWAEHFLTAFQLSECTVSEDGENGATLSREQNHAT